MWQVMTPVDPDNDTTSPDISVVLPTLNEETTIAICISKIQEVFQSMKIRGEIIVSDSSTDSTPEIARSLGAVVVHPEHRGYARIACSIFRNLACT